MTIGKLFVISFAYIILSTAVKIFFIRALNIESQIMVYVMWLFLAIVAIGSVRRLGVLNYLEAFFIAVIWLAVSAVVDLLTLGAMTQYEVYRQPYFTLTYVVLLVSIVVFHKKTHVHIRRAIRSKINQQEK